MTDDMKMRRSGLGTVLGSALLRHVSAEGCQLMVESLDISVGMRIAIVVETGEFVTGTVRWLVSGRAGFAFDQVIQSELRAILESEHPLPTPVRLHAL